MKTKKENSNNPYGCIMIDFECPIWEAKCKQIDNDDLYIVEGDSSYGIETECHVTILYGLHDNVSAEDVKTYLKPISKYKSSIIGISLFENEKFDVLKYDIYCPQASNTNKELMAELDNTCKYKDYKAHMTIAYLKKGAGKKYLDYIPNPIDITPYRFSFSSPDSKINFLK